MVDDDHRPALRSYDEFEGKRRGRRKRPRQDANAQPGDVGAADSPEKVTEDALREAALRYLDRQDASVDQVRKVLRRRIYKYADTEARPSAYDRAEEILRRLQESRILDDDRYARAYAESLRRRGASRPKLLQKLKARGLSDDVIESGLQSLSDQNDEGLSDEGAAHTYARKRRLRERFNLDDPKERQKALAALARQGFSFDVARRVLGL